MWHLRTAAVSQHRGGRAAVRLPKYDKEGGEPSLNLAATVSLSVRRFAAVGEKVCCCRDAVAAYPESGRNNHEVGCKTQRVTSKVSPLGGESMAGFGSSLVAESI